MNYTKRNRPIISVIIPAYNEEKYIAEAIDSILKQTFQDFEIIIVDDGSTDKTFEIISSYSDGRIRLHQQKNKGPAQARNQALKMSRGKYIALQDADDKSKPDRFARQYNYLENETDFIAVGSFADIIDREGDFIFEQRMPERIPRNWSWKASPFIHPSLMFRKKIVKKIGGYPEIPISQDTFFIYKMSKFGKLNNLQESQYQYRLNPSAISRKNHKTAGLVQEVLNIYIKTGELDEKKINEIRKLKEQQTPEEKEYQYHLLLAKKYLWNNYQPTKSRKNIYRIFGIKKIPVSIEPYLILFMSFLGEDLVKNIHQKLK